jgi:tetratricopeptide (TPR) repeat protein
MVHPNRCRSVGIAALCAIAAAFGSSPPSEAADPPGTALSREALALCQRAQHADGAEREALLAQSLERSDEAIAADDRDALAPFARFCALGQQAKLAGMSLTSLFKLRPIRAAVDRALELAPDFQDALLGKGSLLLSVPSILGGDDAEGERLVRRALEIDPDYVGARLTLAQALAERGDQAAARAEAERALSSAERKGEAEQVAEARRLLADLTPRP